MYYEINGCSETNCQAEGRGFEYLPARRFSIRKIYQECLSTTFEQLCFNKA